MHAGTDTEPWGPGKPQLFSQSPTLSGWPAVNPDKYLPYNYYTACGSPTLACRPPERTLCPPRRRPASAPAPACSARRLSWACCTASGCSSFSLSSKLNGLGQAREFHSFHLHSLLKRDRSPAENKRLIAKPYFTVFQPVSKNFLWEKAIFVSFVYAFMPDFCSNYLPLPPYKLPSFMI